MSHEEEDDEDFSSICTENSNNKAKTYPINSILLKATTTTIFYPLEYVKTLMQIGYEPFRPINSVTLLGRRCLLLPNSFEYIKYIKAVDGLSGCFRGLAPKIIQQSVFMYVNQLTANWLQVNEDYGDGGDDTPAIEREQITLAAQIEGDEDDMGADIVRITATSRRSTGSLGVDTIPLSTYLKKVFQDLICRTTSIVISFPFQVIAVRTIAEFVGREQTFSSGIFNGVVQIYKDDGILGFFHGLVPRLIGESIHLVLCQGLRYLVRSQIDTEELRQCLNVSIAILVGNFTYPFTVVSNTMAVCGAGSLAMGKPPLMPEYKNWIDCWQHLSSINQLRRGSSYFFRYYTGPRKVFRDVLVPIGNVTFGPDHVRHTPVFKY